MAINRKPIDRNNRDDLLIQIGITKQSIFTLQREISKIDVEIKSWSKKKKYLESQIKLRGDKISNHENYIKQLENDISKL